MHLTSSAIVDEALHRSDAPPSRVSSIGCAWLILCWPSLNSLKNIFHGRKASIISKVLGREIAGTLAQHNRPHRRVILLALDACRRASADIDIEPFCIFVSGITQSLERTCSPFLYIDLARSLIQLNRFELIEC